MKAATSVVLRSIIISFLCFGISVTTKAGATTSSTPIALTSDDRFVWVVNPDNDSVSVIEVGGDVNTKVAEIAVGKDPQRLAISPDDRKVYVTNQRSGTVSVIDSQTHQVIQTIRVGTEPIGCALTPDGKKLYVANSSSGDVSVIDTGSENGEDDQGDPRLPRRRGLSGDRDSGADPEHTRGRS